METARKRLTEGVLGLFLVVVSVGFASLIARLAGLDPNILNLNQLNIWAPGQGGAGGGAGSPSGGP